MNYLLKLSFLGTNYAGWQVQPGRATVQGALGDAAEAVFGERCSVTGCSRTDSGVHARCFFCTLETTDTAPAIPCERLPFALNSALPEDISVLEASVAPRDFHPRYSARGKEYMYLIRNGRQRDPFLSDRAYFYPKPLDAAVMAEAAKHFVGRHDFSSFMAAGSKITDAVREIYRADVSREGECVRFTVSGSGFLYNMVRILAGTLIGVSEGKYAPGDIPRIIEARDRSAAGPTLPAHGLYLCKVFYDNI